MDYSSMASLLLKSKSIEYVQYYKYFKCFESNKRNKDNKLLRTIYHLHDQLILSICDRAPSNEKNIFLKTYGYNLANLDEFVEWLKDDTYFYPNLEFMLDIYSPEELAYAFNLLIKINMITTGHFYVSTIAINFPVNNKVLPICYAYFSLITYYKKRKRIKNDILDAIKNSKGLLRKKYESMTKANLIELILDNQINMIEFDKISPKSPIFQLIIKELTEYVLPSGMYNYLKEMTPKAIRKKQKEAFIEDSYEDFFSELQDIALDYLDEHKDELHLKDFVKNDKAPDENILLTDNLLEKDDTHIKKYAFKKPDGNLAPDVSAEDLLKHKPPNDEPTVIKDFVPLPPKVTDSKSEKKSTKRKRKVSKEIWY